MPEPKATRSRPAAAGSTESKGSGTSLIPSNPLSASQALLQISLLVGVPLLLLVLARYILHRFFPALGY